MGRSGVSYHVRKPHEPIAATGVICAVFAENRRWTSFAPLGDPPDGEALAGALHNDVMIIAAHDDYGASVRFHAPDGWSAELAIPNDLASIWRDDDWLAQIRNPELVRWEPLTPEQLADWHRRLDALV